MGEDQSRSDRPRGALSVPVAFVNPLLAIACWFLPMPLQWVLDRAKPARLGGVLQLTSRSGRVL